MKKWWYKLATLPEDKYPKQLWRRKQFRSGKFHGRGHKKPHPYIDSNYNGRVINTVYDEIIT